MAPAVREPAGLMPPALGAGQAVYGTGRALSYSNQQPPLEARGNGRPTAPTASSCTPYLMAKREAVPQQDPAGCNDSPLMDLPATQMLPPEVSAALSCLAAAAAGLLQESRQRLQQQQQQQQEQAGHGSSCGSGPPTQLIRQLDRLLQPVLRGLMNPDRGVAAALALAIAQDTALLGALRTITAVASHDSLPQSRRPLAETEDGSHGAELTLQRLALRIHAEAFSALLALPPLQADLACRRPPGGSQPTVQPPAVAAAVGWARSLLQAQALQCVSQRLAAQREAARQLVRKLCSRHAGRSANKENLPPVPALTVPVVQTADAALRYRAGSGTRKLAAVIAEELSATCRVLSSIVVLAMRPHHEDKPSSRQQPPPGVGYGGCGDGNTAAGGVSYMYELAAALAGSNILEHTAQALRASLELLTAAAAALRRGPAGSRAIEEVQNTLGTALADYTTAGHLLITHVRLSADLPLTAPGVQSGGPVASVPAVGAGESGSDMTAAAAARPPPPPSATLLLRRALSGRYVQSLVHLAAEAVLCAADGAPTRGRFMRPAMMQRLQRAFVPGADNPLQRQGVLVAPDLTTTQLQNLVMAASCGLLRCPVSGGWRPVLDLLLRLGRLAVASGQYWEEQARQQQQQQQQREQQQAGLVAAQREDVAVAPDESLITLSSPLTGHYPADHTGGYGGSSSGGGGNRIAHRPAASPQRVVLPRGTACCCLALAALRCIATAVRRHISAGPAATTTDWWGVAVVDRWRLTVDIVAHVPWWLQPDGEALLADCLRPHPHHPQRQQPAEGATSSAAAVAAGSGGAPLLTGQPPTDVAAALAGGLLPCLERLLRRAGREPCSSTGGSGGPVVRLLRRLLLDTAGFALLPLLVHGEPRQVVAFITSLGKLCSGGGGGGDTPGGSSTASVRELAISLGCKLLDDAGSEMKRLGGLHSAPPAPALQQLGLVASEAARRALPPLAAWLQQAASSRSANEASAPATDTAGSVPAGGGSGGGGRSEGAHRGDDRGCDGMSDGGRMNVVGGDRCCHVGHKRSVNDGGAAAAVVAEEDAPPSSSSSSAAAAGAASPMSYWPPELVRSLAADLRAHGKYGNTAYCAELLALQLQEWGTGEQRAGEGDGDAGRCGRMIMHLGPQMVAVLRALASPAEVEAAVLRTCANPACRSLEGDSEVGLRLAACGRCGAAWYCCSDCRTAHWRGGHGVKCGGAAVAVAVGMEAGMTAAGTGQKRLRVS
ncbi:hypothetical protein PLESTM_001462500 [Pleodorina starrii]|nr:hypothetical protein PLESTM_001462500 [Pleodorina starrii]